MSSVVNSENEEVNIIPIRKNSKLYKLAFFVMRKGMVFYDDLVMYSYTFCDDKGEVYRLIRDLTYRGIINIKDIVYKKGTKCKTDKVVRITERGFTMIGITLELDDVRLLRKIRDGVNKIKGKREARLLELNHIKTFFNCAKVQTEPFNKPSLVDISKISLKYMSLELTEDEKSVKVQMERGLFYTDIEIKEYIKEHYPRNNKEPVASAFKGVCFKGGDVIVVYSSPKKKTARMIATHSPLIESKLVDIIKHIFFPLSISALLLGNQPSFIYSSAEGRRYGKHNDNKRNTLYPIIYPENETISRIFSNLYALDINHSCAKYLSNILNRDKVFEEFIKNIDKDLSRKYIREKNEIRYINKDGVKELCVFMPYYELKQLKEIKDSKYTPVILCDKEQVKIIQHIIHKTPKYYDYLSLKEIRADLPIYDKQGNKKGSKLFYDYMKLHNIATTKKEIALLPQKYNMSFNEFFNAIADGTLELDEVIRNIETHARPDISKYRKEYKTILIKSELYDELREYAIKNNRTLKWAASQLIIRNNEQIYNKKKGAN